MQVSVPSWFTMDTRLGSISVHLDTPQCFSAEMYAVDLGVPNASEELKVESPFLSNMDLCLGNRKVKGHLTTLFLTSMLIAKVAFWHSYLY